jgi:hypothetical protein
MKISQRLASRRAVDLFDVQIYRLSVKKAFDKRGDNAKVAVTQELEKMFTKKVFKYVISVTSFAERPKSKDNLIFYVSIGEI